MLKRLTHLTFFAVLMGGVIAPGAAWSEIVLLKSGGRVEGELLNPRRGSSDDYIVRSAEGVELSLAADQVARVVTKSDVQKQYEELLPSVPNTAEGHWKMSLWCKEAGLSDQRRSHLEQVIKHDSDHEEARSALGYSRYGSSWMTPEEYMLSQGYVRASGGWRSRQEVELETRKREHELAAKDWRRKLKIWFDQLDGRRASDALANIQAIRDPLAAPALSDFLANKGTPRPIRLLCLDVLSQLPPGHADGVLIELSLSERDENLRDKCLDELKRSGSRIAIARYTKELNSKDNRIVNRAALCLKRMGDSGVTLSLIDALVTEHKFIIQQGGGPGSMGASFGGQQGGGGGGGGLGGLSMGGKSKMVKTDLKNETVLAALTSLNPGVNFGYDQVAWKRWYLQTHTTIDANLRRDL